MTVYNLRQSGALPGGDIWENSINFESDLLDLADAATVANTFVTDVWSGNGSTITGIKSHFVAGTTVAQCVLDQLDDSTGDIIGRANLAFTTAGTGSGEAMPPRDAILVILDSALFGPKGMGRIFLPPPDVASCTAGLLDSTVQDAVAAAIGLSAAAAAAGDLSLVLYHRATKTTTPVTKCRVSSKFATQNRRDNKVLPTYSSHNI